MATTRIIPLHQNKGKTLSKSLEARINYAANPSKTDNGHLISSYSCNPGLAVSEFALSKKEYSDITGRYQISDVIAYQVRQSFKPGEITPEEANRIGYEFAERFTKGNYAFIVCTHTDKAHIHNHIIWNSTALDCTRKFRNFWGSTEAVRRLSDQICIEHRLSVIPDLKGKGISYDRWLGTENKLSNRDTLRMAVDLALQSHPKTVQEFLSILEKSGHTVKKGKYISIKYDGQQKFIRLRTLGPEYSEESIEAIIKGNRIHKPFVKKKYPDLQKRAEFISTLESKINSGKGAGYDQAMKVIKLKQMAKTIMFIEEHGYTDLAEFANDVMNVGERISDLLETIKSAESRLDRIQDLRNHIFNSIRTKDVWQEYRKSGYSKKYLSEHEGEIALYKASQKAFAESGLKKIPTIQSLNEEHKQLLADKKAAYTEYQNLKKDMRELMIHKANAEYILGSGQDKIPEMDLQHE